MERGNPHDPLLLQVLATGEELLQAPEYSQDPLQEIKANPLPGVIHKYANRLLLILTGVCAINCRFCFRRHFAYAENNPGQEGWQQAIKYIQKHPNIQEVILSGGDPLLASDAVLERLLCALESLDQIQTVRFHSRIPIVLPERIQPALCAILANKRFRTVMVFHCNHPNELDSDVLQACKHLQEAGCLLLNQSVLLKGINDNADVLTLLSQQLFKYGVLPYYLHLLDPIQGAQHFDISHAQVWHIYHELQSKLPGYLVPKLVREEAGKHYKTIIGNVGTTKS